VCLGCVKLCYAQPWYCQYLIISLAHIEYHWLCRPCETRGVFGKGRCLGERVWNLLCMLTRDAKLGTYMPDML